MKLSLKKNLTVPNILTVLRIVLIVPLMRFLLRKDYIMAGLVLLLSAVSDMLDGMIARRFHQMTALGKILDPIADKLTLIAAVVCVNVLYPGVTPFVCVLLLKELLMLAGGAFLLQSKRRPPAAQWYGKLSTIIFYTSVTVLILLRAVWGYTDRTLTIILLAVTTGCMLFSLVMYTRLFFRLLQGQKKEEEQTAGKG